MALPLGSVLEWKLVAGQPANVRWESGDDRTAFAAPPALLSSDALELRARWR